MPHEGDKYMAKRRIKGFIPFIIFLIIAVFLWRGLRLDPRKIPSALIDKPAPTIHLATVFNPEQYLTNQDFKNKVTLVHVWATWCVSCFKEHPLLMNIAKNNKDINIFGIDYKDDRVKAKVWLTQYGNPYIKSGFDEKGKTIIDWGVYGTPELFVLDKQGIIRYKHADPLSKLTWEQEVLPIINKLKKA